MKRVEGKIALITGAGRGIGAATARLLAAEGATVIVTDVLAGAGNDVAKEIGGTFYQLNVANEDQWKTLSVQVGKQFGRLDILFNNAGIMGFGVHAGPQNPEECSLETWHHVHNINLDGVFLGCKYGIGLMKKTGGSIINMASRSGVVGIPGACAYASSKAAIRNHTKSVALYCAQQGYKIRCNVISPATILTHCWDTMLPRDIEQRQQKVKEISKGIPLGMMGEPLDIAYAVVYLASEESKYMTGSELTLDGGILAGSTAAPEECNE